MICSWNNEKPTLNSDGTYSISTHTNVGGKHINLLGGSPDPPKIQDNAGTFTVAAKEVFYWCTVFNVYFPIQARVPNADTTYWCEAMKLPQAVLQNEKYIVKVCIQIFLR